MLVGLTTAAQAGEYEVQPGDSLSVIARAHGVSTAELAAANAISDLHLIRVGQVLTIPGQVHVVSAGESLSVIARTYGVSTADLAAANDIGDANVIRVGQELRIPGAAAAPANPAAGYANLPSKLWDDPERLELIPSFERWAAHYDIDPALLMAISYRESGWQTDVISSKGAVGVGQLMPRTSEWVADALIGTDLDPYNPDDNIRMSARFLAWLIGYMGSEEMAAAAYYQGPGSVRAIGYYDDTTAYVTNVFQIRSMFVKG
jgi:soluble lytic murein transglycosylase-like protein